MNMAVKMTVGTAAAFALTASAYALPININMSGDNILNGGVCEPGLTSCTGWGDLGATNLNDWRQSDSISVDLARGSYDLLWTVSNDGTPGSGNPAGLLAEISWGGNTRYSSGLSDWQVLNLATGERFAATSYGSNGGSNIWTDNNGGALSGISTNAEWILGGANFADAPRTTVLHTSISVPEPGTLALFGGGLLALGLLLGRRRLSGQQSV